MIIVVSGTPGTGKTTFAKKLAKRLLHKIVDIKVIIKKNKLDETFDKKRDCSVIDEKKLVKILVSLIKKEKNLIIDGHLSHEIQSKYVDLCIITKCDLKKLKTRLQKRGYSKEKIRENLDSEIFDICLTESQEKGHKIMIADTTNKNTVLKLTTTK